ncbi:KEOPS complex subunit Pcc1 [Methanothermococcus sp.]|uniref:KEOPS complex subunit Pcc1 n=1 Tax=Methanothermococcus sp. TaxID=2614238 RepID=UPI0025EDB07B|nr:KEOPS complex subunit Pcc1 [Methanothermococcus sp.]
MITFKMKIPANENIVKSLKVDDVSNGLIIKTTYNKNIKSLELLIKTNSIGSLKNILDDYFINYDMVKILVEYKKI